MHKPKNTLLAVLLLVGLVLVTGCKTPTAPTVVITLPSGTIEVMAGETVTFTATVTNPDNVKTTLDWIATGGALVPDTGGVVTWTAGADSGHFRVSVIATGDGIADKDTNFKDVLVRKWVRTEVEYDNTDHIDIPNPGDTVSPITFTNDASGDEQVAVGALVDSLSCEIDVTYGPDSFPDLDIWVKSPDGTQVQIWNSSQSGDPTGFYDPSVFATFKDKAVTGTWKLVVHSGTAEAPGWIDDFYLTVWYRNSVP